MRRRIRTLDVLRLVFSVLAVGLIIYGLFTMRETSRSRGWVDTTGRVVTSTINEFTGKNGAITYRPMVLFSYSVNGVLFTSNHFTFRDTGSRNRDAAARTARRYPAGSTVQVFYDPLDPGHAVLERGGNPWLPIAAGGVFSMLAVLVRILRGREEKRSAA